MSAGPFKNKIGFPEALPEPNIEIFGLVVNVDSAGFIVWLFVIPFILGYLIQKERIAGIALFISVLAGVELFHARHYYIPLSYKGEAVIYQWSWLWGALKHMLPGVVVGYVAAIALTILFRRASDSRGAR